MSGAPAGSSKSFRWRDVRDRRLELLADVLVGYSTEVREGDLVRIGAPLEADPLAYEVCRSVLQAGGHPLVQVTTTELVENLYFRGSDAQLDWVNPAFQDAIEQADVLIGLDAASNTKHLSRVDPARQARVSAARKPVLDRYLARAAQGELRWVGTLFPTQAAAQDAEMSLPEYEDFVYRAGFLDRDDPVALWRQFGTRLERIAASLGERTAIRIVAEETDLTLGVEGRTWLAAGGKTNFPDGEVFTGPVEESVEGTIRFTFPAVFNAREVEDVRLRFEGGRVVEASAGRGEAFLQEMIAMDDGAARVGEFAFGMNEAVTMFTRHTLFDEKIAGTVHLALGASYPETGGRNESALHWDMVCDLRGGSEVYADGELVYRDGSFLDGAGD